MPTKHITKQLEAFLDNQLSGAERRQIEEHLAVCPTCANRLFEARRISQNLGPIVNRALGQPRPPATLRTRIREQILAGRGTQSFLWAWTTSGRMLNALGTLAIVGVVALGAYAVMQSSTTRPDQARGQNVTTDARQDTGLDDLQPVSTPTLPLSRTTTSPENENADNEWGLTTLGESVTEGIDNAFQDSVFNSPSQLQQNLQVSPSASIGSVPDAERPAATEPQASPAPAGTIAFSQFNPATELYEIYLIKADGTGLEQYPLDGISEPALRRADDGTYQIAYRAWGETTAPRALISNNLTGNGPKTVSHFWEDAQPDWSPTENRIIFASQRESDRRWRLYTVWGDGSEEINLRREGRSPSFAPDGSRFVFESCDSYLTRNQCGLWLGDLENSEYGSRPILLDPLAQAPDWSPQAKIETIAYMTNTNGNWDLYVTDSEGGNVRRLTTSPAIDGLPAWSPDG
ncbi:MAG: zf-HC2 domain-containing protein, partial [Anaerolineae bacterium]|nr:zf-HC2 domain-containing protein [Anaerolineae bacterium]